MKTDEYLDFVLDYYRAEMPGAADAAIFEVMVAELGAESPATVLLAQRIKADMALPAPRLARPTGADPFYQSFEWRRIRQAVLVKAKGRCAACGRSPHDGITLNVDHIKPRGRYPHLALDPNNLQVLCDECNHGKGNLFETDWRRPQA